MTSVLRMPKPPHSGARFQVLLFSQTLWTGNFNAWHIICCEFLEIFPKK